MPPQREHLRSGRARAILAPPLGARRAGFSLVELLVALAILAILLNVAAPSFADLTADLALSRAYNGLASDLRFARSEAIKAGGTVTVCAREDVDSCGEAWSAGWHVFVEGAGGTVGVLDDGEVVLRSRQGERTRLRVAAGAVLRADELVSRSSIGFDSRGRADWTLGTVVLCDRRDEAAAVALVVNGAGGFRRASETAASPDVVTDAFGDPVECPAATEESG